MEENEVSIMKKIFPSYSSFEADASGVRCGNRGIVEGPNFPWVDVFYEIDEKSVSKDEVLFLVNRQFDLNLQGKLSQKDIDKLISINDGRYPNKTQIEKKLLTNAIANVVSVLLQMFPEASKKPTTIGKQIFFVYVMMDFLVSQKKWVLEHPKFSETLRLKMIQLSRDVSLNNHYWNIFGERMPTHSYSLRNSIKMKENAEQARTKRLAEKEKILKVSG